MTGKSEDKFGKEVSEGDVVEYAVYGPGPGKPYQQPTGILSCFVAFVDLVGELYLDPRCDKDHRTVIEKASPDYTTEQLEESNWLLVCSDPEDVKLTGKAIKI